MSTAPTPDMPSLTPSFKFALDRFNAACWDAGFRPASSGALYSPPEERVYLISELSSRLLDLIQACSGDPGAIGIARDAFRKVVENAQSPPESFIMPAYSTHDLAGVCLVFPVIEGVDPSLQCELLKVAFENIGRLSYLQPNDNNLASSHIRNMFGRLRGPDYVDQRQVVYTGLLNHVLSDNTLPEDQRKNYIWCMCMASLENNDGEMQKRLSELDSDTFALAQKRHDKKALNTGHQPN